MAAGQELGLAPVAGEHRHCLFGRSSPLVLERSGDHRVSPPDPVGRIVASPDASSRTLDPLIAAQTRCGEAGIGMSVTPNGESASTMAFITAGVAAIVPASPMPFTPI